MFGKIMEPVIFSLWVSVKCRLIGRHSILARASDKIDLILLEALLIKEYKPIINIQTDDFSNNNNNFY